MRMVLPADCENPAGPKSPTGCRAGPFGSSVFASREFACGTTPPPRPPLREPPCDPVPGLAVEHQRHLFPRLRALPERFEHACELDPRRVQVRVELDGPGERHEG